MLILALVVSFSASDLADAGARIGARETAVDAAPAPASDCSPQNLAHCAAPGARLSLTAAGFQPGSAELPEALARQLVPLSASLREQRAVVRVEVHTDASGNAADSQSLSQRRADAIRSYLIDRGVDPYRVQAVGMGFNRPKRPADPLAAENRRVEIVHL